jgi:hypothetical protein
MELSTGELIGARWLELVAEPTRLMQEDGQAAPIPRSPAVLFRNPALPRGGVFVEDDWPKSETAGELRKAERHGPAPDGTRRSIFCPRHPVGSLRSSRGDVVGRDVRFAPIPTRLYAAARTSAMCQQET